MQKKVIVVDEALDLAGAKAALSIAKKVKPGERAIVEDMNGWQIELTKNFVKRGPVPVDYNSLNKNWYKGDGNADYTGMSEGNFAAIAEMCDFELWYIENRFKKKYFLKDTQYANLGGIEGEVFCTPQEAIERLSGTYFEDYLGEG